MRRFVVDTQLPAALARWIEAKGGAAEHVLALQFAQSGDETIWAWAARHAAVIVSKDEDFAQMTLLRTEPVAVVWLRFGNCRTPTLLASMERAWLRIVEQLEAGVAGRRISHKKSQRGTKNQPSFFVNLRASSWPLLPALGIKL